MYRGKLENRVLFPLVGIPNEMKLNCFIHLNLFSFKYSLNFYSAINRETCRYPRDYKNYTFKLFTNLFYIHILYLHFIFHSILKSISF